MKILSPILIALIGLLSVNNAFAQNVGSPKDSIFYHGTDSLDMLILAKDYHNLVKDDQLQSILYDFQSRLKEIQGRLPATAYTIEYQYLKQMDILESDKIISFSLTEDNSMSQNFRNRAKIVDPSGNYQVFLGFNDIRDVIKADLQPILTAIIGGLPAKHRFSRYLEFQPDHQNGKITLSEERHTGYFDMLSLQAGVGANVYRGKFLTDFTGEIGLQWSQKGILKNQWYISNNLMFFFDAENRAVINNFTNVGYRRNFSTQKDQPNWLGIELGTLTKRSGDIFQSNTMRLGVNWQAGKHITVAPQLYFNGFFQQVSPGFRIGIGL
jgi:hypothetical protein